MIQPHSTLAPRSKASVREFKSYIVELVNDHKVGLGIRIKGGKGANDQDLGIFVKEVTNGSIAQYKGVLVDDKIVAINGNDVRHMTNDKVAEALQLTAKGRSRLILSIHLDHRDEIP